MSKERNIWLDRFDGLDDPEELRRRATIPARPIKDVQNIPQFTIRQEIATTLAGFYFPSDVDVSILMNLVEQAQAHSWRRYPNLQTYLSDVYRPLSQFDTAFIPPQCLTGPAGVGKSALIKALGRVLPADTEVDFGSQHPKANLFGNLHIEVRDHSTLKAMLMPFVQEQYGPSRRVANSELTKVFAKSVHMNGVPLLTLDELQFLTQSALASTLIAKVLYQLAYVGVPLVYVANYSLCRLLLKREEQDTQRLMTSPLVLLPPSPSGDHWLEYLKQFKIILGPSFQIDVEKEFGAIYHLTAGLKRLTIHLTSIAYQNVWRQGRRQICIDDLAFAYEGIDFSANRSQVEDMLLSHPSKKNKIYECPFPLPPEENAILDKIRKETREKALLYKVQQEIMTPEEKKRSKGQRSVLPMSTPSKSAATRKPGRSKPVSAEELLETELHRRGRNLYPRKPSPPG